MCKAWKPEDDEPEVTSPPTSNVHAIIPPEYVDPKPEDDEAG